MLMNYTSQYANCNRLIKQILVLVVWLLMISFGVHALSTVKHSKETVQRSKPGVPLLLNSGIVEAEKAEVSIILWFEDRKIPLKVWLNKPTADWIWTYKDLQNNNEKESVTLTGQCSVNKNEERNLLAWYTTMVPQIEKAGGKIYLDERIPKAIDISAYLNKTNAEPSQWVLVDNMVSIAAYQNKIETSVSAGQDQVNIQLLSRGNMNERKSVLAIPALLKEF